MPPSIYDKGDEVVPSAEIDALVQQALAMGSQAEFAPAPPTLFDSALFDELLALRGDVGARSVIARHSSVVVEEPFPWPAPRDVDTLDDLDDYLNRDVRDETYRDR